MMSSERSRATRVVAAWIERDGRVLVQRRPPDRPRPNAWEFPGGKVEPGELDDVALERECLEELGVRVTVGRLLAETEHVYPELTIHLLLYEAHLPNGTQPEARDAQSLSWVRGADLDALELCPADYDLVRRVVGAP